MNEGWESDHFEALVRTSICSSEENSDYADFFFHLIVSPDVCNLQGVDTIYASLVNLKSLSFVIGVRTFSFFEPKCTPKARCVISNERSN